MRTAVSDLCGELRITGAQLVDQLTDGSDRITDIAPVTRHLHHHIVGEAVDLGTEHDRQFALADDSARASAGV